MAFWAETAQGRNHRRPYHLAGLLSGVTMLAFQYLMAAIPHMDPGDPGAKLFSSDPFLTGMTMLVTMAIFAILAAVMASRFAVEEYSGKRAILMLMYPVSRRRMLAAKLTLVFCYPAIAMFLCGAAIQAPFCLTETLFLSVPSCSRRERFWDVWPSCCAALCWQGCLALSPSGLDSLYALSR